MTVGFENYDSIDHGFSADARFNREAVRVIIIKNSCRNLIKFSISKSLYILNSSYIIDVGPLNILSMQILYENIFSINEFFT
jgi:hypothetical protein